MPARLYKRYSYGNKQHNSYAYTPSFATHKHTMSAAKSTKPAVRLNGMNVDPAWNAAHPKEWTVDEANAVWVPIHINVTKGLHQEFINKAKLVKLLVEFITARVHELPSETLRTIVQLTDFHHEMLRKMDIKLGLDTDSCIKLACKINEPQLAVECLQLAQLRMERIDASTEVRDAMKGLYEAFNKFEAANLPAPPGGAESKIKADCQCVACKTVREVIQDECKDKDDKNVKVLKRELTNDEFDKLCDALGVSPTDFKAANA